MGKSQGGKLTKDSGKTPKHSGHHKDIPSLFSKKNREAAQAKMAPARAEEPDDAVSLAPDSSDVDSETDSTMDVQTYLKRLPSKSDIKEMLHTMTDEIRSELHGIKQELESVGARTDSLERNQTKLVSNHKLHRAIILKQSKEIEELHRHVEDLQNRSRRNNIRVRGVPETVQKDAILPTLLQIFNGILEREAHTVIPIDRAHRVYKPRNAPPDAPRDILCCINDFPTKEKILLKARKTKQLSFEDNAIILLQD
ncbi:hypothetical protein XELAEV_18029824mg, partial [Xenopus laevis]